MRYINFYWTNEGACKLIQHFVIFTKGLFVIPVHVWHVHVYVSLSVPDISSTGDSGCALGGQG